MQDDQADGAMPAGARAAAARMGLPIAPACEAGVAANLALLARHAAIVRDGSPHAPAAPAGPVAGKAIGPAPAQSPMLALAADVRAGRRKAVAVARAAIDALAADAHVAVTRLFAARALDEAARVDAIVAAGGDPGVLAGVPY
ncbi:MAG TPA: AtzG-like protein, partial [Novosphingobium sp.]|nr:AtzG-like protein [Novosphingobium sp.]